MRRAGWLLSIGLVAATNLIVLAGVAYNRSGAPDAEVTLTEREVALPWRTSEIGEEDTGVSLRLRTAESEFAWRPAADGAITGRPWLDQGKLE